MLSDLYSDKLFEAAASIPTRRRLPAPAFSARRERRVCGSTVGVDLLVENGRVADIGLDEKACALGQAAAAITANNIIGAPIEDLYRLRDQMRAMLKTDGPPPEGARWRDLALLAPIKDYPQRHASTLLIFEAICAALDQARGSDAPVSTAD